MHDAEEGTRMTISMTKADSVLANSTLARYCTLHAKFQVDKPAKSEEPDSDFSYLTQCPRIHSYPFHISRPL
jgi:hypothetical protein